MTNKPELKVTIAHDYLCPWCWIGVMQAKRLKEEFPQIRQEWVGYELLPEALGPLPDYTPKPSDPNEPPAPPSRLDLLAELDNIPIPKDRTIGIIRTHNPLQGAEYVNEHAPDRFDEYNEAVYRAFWERSEDISDLGVLAGIAAGIGIDPKDFTDKLAAKAYSSKIVEFDDDAYAADVTHVPTFIFRGERCAEAPYSTIREMALRYLAWNDKS
ncbi:MAG: DsbA family protein [Capsulimonas sp.]|uniref:DsbA family oxidoreductase n=1 Tax=Capsulimonas sp. TaxID=2494211 RepID=UPI0032649D78